jgi:radical SAM superfamily enzyme YgiQ (UPF0313 family)
MKLTLVQTPLLATSKEALVPPLGLLGLAAIAREQDVDVTIVDLNLQGLEDPAFLSPDTFYEQATRRVAATDPDLVGFTSMAVDGHVGLELARRLKMTDGAVRTLFGGAHYSAIAQPLLTAYPWVDFVARGAAERGLLALLRRLTTSKPLTSVPGVASRNGRVVDIGDVPMTRLAIDDLPFPAYDLIDLHRYFTQNPARHLCYEHARGCNLRCSFCYSETHWGHGEERRSIDRVIEDLARLEALGTRDIFFVADNFVNHRTQARELSAAIQDASLDLSWGCYATLAQLDEDTVAAMAGAGCRSVFVGVDAASDHNKKTFRKTYFKGWDALHSTLRRCLAHAVRPTCSFMVSTDDTEQGIETTLRTAALSQHAGAEVYVNALAVYGGTTLAERQEAPLLRYSESRPRLMLDTPEINWRNDFARTRPSLFPFHQAPPTSRLLGDLFTFCHTARHFLRWAPRTCVQHALDDDKSLVRAFRSVANGIDGALSSGGTLADTELLAVAASMFQDLLPDSGPLSSIFALDLFHEVGAASPATVDVLVNGVARRCQVNPSVVLELPAHPARIDWTRQVPDSTTRRSYVVARTQDGHTATAELSVELSERLAEMSRRIDAKPVLELDFSGYQELKHALVLRPLVSGDISGVGAPSPGSTDTAGETAPVRSPTARHLLARTRCQGNPKGG